MSDKLVNYYNLTVEQVKEEASLLTVEKIRHYPCTPSHRDGFYELWNRFGPEAARTAILPAIWQGHIQRPSEFYGIPLQSANETDVSSTSES